MAHQVLPIETLYFTVATAGHVDHGKTSLIKALTGIDPDRLKEEKERQMTTDLGFAHRKIQAQVAETQGKELIVGFIDVPGHGKFLKNMLAGVGGIDLALLVVASDEGPMPQTIQHIKILSLLGINKAIVVITKTDLTSLGQQDEVIKQVQELLGRYKILALDSIKVSVPKNEGFDQLIKVLACSLTQQVQRGPIVNTGTAPHVASDNASSELAYLPIDRVFSKAGYGVVVTGTLVRGTISVSDSIFIEPGSLKGRVRGLETFKHTMETAHAGQRLAVNLVLKENKPLARGQAIFGKQRTPSLTLIVELIDPDIGEMAAEKISGQPVRVYHGTAECIGQMRWIETIDLRYNSREQNLLGRIEERDPSAATTVTSPELPEPGSIDESRLEHTVAQSASPSRQRGLKRTIGQIALMDPIVAEPQDRYVLRYGEEGILGGSILLTTRPRWLTRPKIVQLAQLFIEENLADAAMFLIDASPQKMLRQDVLLNFLPISERDQYLATLLSTDKLVKMGDYLLNQKTQLELTDKLLEHLSHLAKITDTTDRQLRSSSENVRTSLLPGLDRTVFQQIIRNLMEAGKVARSGDRVSLKDESSTSVADAVPTYLLKKITKVLTEHLCLELDELALQCGLTRKEINQTMQVLSREGIATVVAYDYASLNTTLQRAHELLYVLWQKKKDISPGEFREALGVSRKYTMALLTHFDDNKITRRVGTGRVLLKTPT